MLGTSTEGDDEEVIEGEAEAEEDEDEEGVEEAAAVVFGSVFTLISLLLSPSSSLLMRFLSRF